MLRAPLLHFLILGVMLFAAQRWLDRQANAPPQQIKFTQADVAGLRAQWQAETGRPPDADEFRATLRHAADQIMLAHEAMSLGLDRHDRVVQQRLHQNMKFLFPEQTMDSAKSVALGRQLGMLEHDLVVQRRLAQRMEARLIRDYLPLPQGPDDTLMQAAPQPARHTFRFRHVWLGERLTSESSELASIADALKQGEDSRDFGKPFALGNEFSALSQSEIKRRFGQRLSTSVASADPGQWFGPVESIYGLHFLRVDARGQVVSLNEEKRRLVDARERAESAALEAGLKEMRTRYSLQIDGAKL